MGPTQEFLEHVSQRRARLRQELAAIVTPGSSVVVEIGCGHGHFLTRYAYEHPHKLCLGVDLIGERVARAQRKADRARLTNCHFIRAEARELIDEFAADITFAEIWVLFPDPWPKKRHHKNRILQPKFFDFLAARTGQGTRLHFRTDHAEYFRQVAAFLPAVLTWKIDPAAPWPLEHETVFQARAPSYQSLIVVRTGYPATRAGTIEPPL